jgi:predicted phage tail protein
MNKVITSVFTLLATLLVAAAVQVTVSWAPNPPEQNVISYNVLISTNAGPYAVLANTSSTSYVIADLPTGSYGFKVQAVSLAGPGPDSSQTLTPGVPGAVETPSLAVTNGNNLTLSWNAKPADQYVTSYEVWVSTNGAPIALTATLPGTSLAFPAMPTGSYAFQVRAVNLAGPGSYSPVVNSPGAPGAPQAPTLTYQ